MVSKSDEKLIENEGKNVENLKTLKNKLLKIRKNTNFSDYGLNTNKKLLTYVVKRVIDFIISLGALIVLSPLLLIISIAIKIDSKGPVIFKQERTGKDGKVFYLHKFRSMVANNNVMDFSNEDEHTRVGNFLRKTSLDEIPQLYDVLRGKMALIGPRPWITEYYENMTKTQRHRYDVLPGITGLAQVKGRNNISIHKKINYDLEYVKNYSLIQDIKIIFMTIKVVLAKVGADAGKTTIKTEIDELKEQEKIEIKM